ncbi:DUF4651 domain-containing protein [Streptococcus caviae]|uniref:DUF4651 domain-containing protein n=1 Tax=Streptococcus sp. 'caviae' TaxID=1915004 RepID=UPI00094B97E2|nr:DUF4651 domain-containing protein [Streptococcus sp. 'caviae']OLN83257.1 hypothetical protein BMI76_05965 [Streptococcus sp. 'caviae']
MKSKKITLVSAGLAGISGAALAGLLIQQRLADQRRNRIKKKIRQFFSQFGEIAVLYINEFESDKKKLRGGVVMQDDTVYQFTYQNGSIDYEEEKR